MDDTLLLRYSRHLLLPEIDIPGQERFMAAHVLLIGAGGLGSAAALYLAASGVGTLTLADGDNVDLTNLQRQVLHCAARLGQNKAHSGAAHLAELNPHCQVQPIPHRLQGEALTEAVRKADVVLDCSDNFATRHAINRACVTTATPLVSGAATRFDGQIAVFDVRHDAAPCYHCLFPEAAMAEDTDCATLGIFAPLTGIIGAMQAAEALKLLAGCGTPLSGRLLLLDGLAMNWRSIHIPRDPACAVCSPIRRKAA